MAHVRLGGSTASPDMSLFLRPTSLCLFLIALGVRMDSLMAGDKLLEGDSLGKLTIGQNVDRVTALLGKPDSKGKDELWDATGEWVQEWRYKAQGLNLHMASKSKGTAKAIANITALPPCKLATARGIRIGNSIAEVTKAYKNVQDKEQSVPAKTFVAGSIYGGVIFTFEGGTVWQIFIGAAAE